MPFIRRLLALVLCAALLIVPASAENETASYSYTLDIDMNAAAYPAKDQELLCGIADLLNMLHISGVYATDGVGFDNSISLVLADDERTRTDLQISGIPEVWWLNSSLFGTETLGINNVALLEFAMKAYAHLEMPLQYPALLINPYVHTSAFEWIMPEWEDVFGGTKTRTVKRKTILSLAEFISANGENDRAFYYWVQALARDIGIETDILDSLYFLPDWVKAVIDKNGIKITVKDDTETWKNGSDILFTRTQTDDADAWQLTLPADDFGNILSASYHQEGADVRFDLSITASEPGDVLVVSLTGTNLPDAIPFTGSFLLQINASGSILPAPIDLHFNAISDGHHFIISQTDAATGDAMLTLSGRISAVSSPADLAYKSKPALTECVNLLSVSDASLADLLTRIARPMITGVWPILVKAPASAFASLFALLEQYDVLEMVINSFE